ncbi:DNA mismatch repair protein [Gramella sp. MT6]|uniref:MutH/Sau3AI family endonuclease n=1 Tax=Gramella sp. MT6 TaxID=2705471 RepID=UPI001C5D2B6C|nr:MutH/Sau3AI family endonuclease [Gramella sp. MT6]QYA24277.1 DNA mismatch repair protein [Gramella sp. MT6]
MRRNRLYDITDPFSIEKFARRIEGKSLKELLGDELANSYSGKGKLGQLVEDSLFGYKPNSKAEPDFKEAGVELKTAPIKKNSKGLVSKERLVFNIIDYNQEYKFTFRESSFWKKNQLLLLMFYLHDNDKISIDYLFKIVRLWRFPLTDLKIIKDDWNKIVRKIKEGKAHEISEGDTLYLGACTKGSTAKTSKRDQPFSEKRAPQRAFSLKSKYLNFIIQRSLKGDRELPKITDDYLSFLEEDFRNEAAEPTLKYGGLFEDQESAVKDLSQYKEGQTFEEFIVEKFSKFYGFSETEIINYFKLNINIKAKNKSYVFARSILGVKKDKIEEFEKSDIQIKTVKFENNFVLKESMSFAQIKYNEIIEEEWENSYLQETLSKKFFFVIFKKDENGKSRLYKTQFWNMPYGDIQIGKRFWKDIKHKVKIGNYNDFWKISDNQIFHVRPKAANSSDLMPTPQGTYEKKKAYWINSSYIKEQILSEENQKY